MQRIILSAWIFCICLSTTSYAPIFQSHQINVVREHAQEEGVVVVFDLDNTVMEPVHDHGSDQWFSAMIKCGMQYGFDLGQSVDKILPVYFDLQSRIQVKPVEVDVLPLIQFLQENGIPVIALTARSLPLMDRTIQLLTSIGVDFSKTSISSKEHAFTLHHEAHFKAGIMFCGKNDKGETLRELFRATLFQPKKIVFADDKESCLVSVEKMAQELQVAFIGIRYAHCDEKVNAFQLDPDHGHIFRGDTFISSINA